MYNVYTYSIIILQTVYKHELGATGSPVLSTGGATDYTKYALTASARITRVIKKKKKKQQTENKERRSRNGILKPLNSGPKR